MPRNAAVIRRSDFAARGAEGKAARAEWRGVRELKKELDQIVAHLEGTERVAAIRDIDKEVVGPAAEMIRDAWKARTGSARWPAAVTESIFAYTDLSRQQGKRRMALVGVPTGSPRSKNPSIRSKANPRGLFVEWGKRTGKKVGMSLARIYESGTRKFPGRPALQNTLHQIGQQALAAMAAGYRGVLADWRARYPGNTE